MIGASFLRLGRWAGVFAWVFVWASGARAQLDNSRWTLFSPTGDVAEIRVQGSTAFIAADGGIVKFDLSTVGSSSPTQSKIGQNDGLVDGDLTSFAVDGFGNLWAGTKDKGISVFDSQGRHLQDLTSFESIRSDLVVDIEALGNRVFVVSTDEYTPQGGLSGGGYVPIDVAQSGSTFTFTPDGLGVPVNLAQVILPETGQTWIGTAGFGLLRKDETVAGAPEVVLTQANGLRSNNVGELARGPNPDQAGASVLWVGSGEGLQTWDGATLTDISFFDNRNILDIYIEGSTLVVLAETDALDRDIYRASLSTAPLGFSRISRSDCLPDTLYVPREVAIDSSGRICLGTRDFAFSVRDGLTWKCPPPLGPHFAQVSDLTVAPDGVLYFATGEKGPFNLGVGIGTFDGTSWGVITELPGGGGLVNRDIHEVAFWPDTTMWFGSAISANFGGLDHYFPKTGAFVRFHDTVSNPNQIIQGKNIRALEKDRFNNLWVVVGQNQGIFGGGVSVIAYPSQQITNYPISEVSAGSTQLLRDGALDTRDRIWVTTFSDQSNPSFIMVIDPRGTIHNKSDDHYTTINVVNEIADLGTIDNIEIDSQDQIWLAGDKGIVVGQIISDDTDGDARADWTPVSPSVDQTGGRNPLPYTVAELDTDGSIWFGTESAGIVNVSKDRETWTWYDQLAGEPLPDQSIMGLYLDPLLRNLWIGTATAGIARLSLTPTTGNSQEERIDAEAFPNPWNPRTDGVLAFRAIPTDEVVSMRIYNLAGEMVHEGKDLRGTKSWTGRNRGAQFVESGTYLMTATSTAGKSYKARIAVVR